MSIQEILEAHTQSIRNGRCFCEDRGPKRTGIEHAAHVAEVLEKYMQEREAKAWDACARSIVYEDGTPVQIMSITNPYK